MITRLHLKNFKNFRDATLQLGPLTVLVGTNASGKSNLRDAFRFVHGMARGYSLAEIIGEKYGEGGVLQWRGIRGGTREVAYHGEDSFALETEIDVPPGEGGVSVRMSHAVDVHLLGRHRKPYVVREELCEGASVAYRAILDEGPTGKLILVAAEDSRPLEFSSSKPILTQVSHDGSTRLDCQWQGQFLTDELASMRFLDLAPDAMRQPSIPGQVVLGDRGENLSSVIQAICEDGDLKHALTEWVNELTPLDVADFDFVEDQTGKILLMLVESSGQRTSAYSASDGTLRFLAMIAAILGPDAANFYFLEELDNGIHPTRLHLLLQLIEQYARQGKVQVVATTHSPQMLAMLSEEAREHASLVYRLGNEPEAKICRIVDIPEAKSVLEDHNLARLHESGWLENAVAFAESEEAST
jgi:predicted ATPase